MLVDQERSICIYLMAGLFRLYYFERISFLYCINCKQWLAIWHIHFQSCSVLVGDIQLTGALAGEQSCRYPFGLWPPELPGAPGVTVGRKICKQVSWATSWMSAAILEEEILRVHQIARESLDSSPSFVLQKDIIKIFIVTNTLLYSFHFSKSWQSFKVLILFYLLSVKTFLSAPNHGSWFLPNSSGAKRKNIIVIKSWCRPEFSCDSYWPCGVGGYLLPLIPDFLTLLDF